VTRSLSSALALNILLGIFALASPTLAATSPSQSRAEAITWLLEHQNPSGSWGSDPRREALVTAVALGALRDAGVVGSPQNRRAEAWLASSAPPATGDLGAMLRALDASDLVLDTTALQDELDSRRAAHDTSAGTEPGFICLGGTHNFFPCSVAHGGVSPETCVQEGGECVGSWFFGTRLLPHTPLAQSSESGWGADFGHRSDVPSTAAALEALRAAGNPSVDTPAEIDAVVDHLLATQVATGPDAGAFRLASEPPLAELSGWPQAILDRGPAVFATARAIVALESVSSLRPDVDSAIADAVAWLRAVQKPGGGWGDAASTVEETALAYVALRTVGVPASDPALDNALAGFLLATQSSSGSDRGSWGGAPYATALALDALNRSGLATDTDGDGLPDPSDPDDDGDNVCDPGQTGAGCSGTDAFPLDPSETADADGDGLGDNADPDRDGDGFCDPSQSGADCVGTDLFPTDPNAHADLDNDGTPDAFDADIDGDGAPNVADAFPFNPAETLDTDADGIGNAADPDDDADGFCDPGESGPDCTGVDAFPLDPAESRDSDGDGIGNNADQDDDNDGILDTIDNCPAIDVACLWKVDEIDGNPAPDTRVRISGPDLAWTGPGATSREVFRYAGATRSVEQLTDDAHEDFGASISISRLAWMRLDGSDLDVFAFSGSDIVAVTDDPADDILGSLHLGVVVWERSGDIFYHDFAASVDPTTQLTAGAAQDREPVLSLFFAPTVAWIRDAGGQSDVYFARLSDNIPVAITSNGVHKSFVRITRRPDPGDNVPTDRVAWCEGATSVKDCFVHTVQTGETATVVSGQEISSLSLEGPMVAWSASDGADFDIYMRDLAAGGSAIQITDDDAQDERVEVSTTHILWRRSSPLNGVEVRIYQIATGKTTLLTEPALPAVVDAEPTLEGKAAAWVGMDAATGDLQVVWARAEPPVCDNGLDDDGDGLEDYPADPGCRLATHFEEDPECNDKIDNDGDGGVDWDGGGVGNPDPDCSSADDDKEQTSSGGGGGGGCGLLGVEALFALLLLARRRRGRVVSNGSEERV